jgi:hypothetical protein
LRVRGAKAANGSLAAKRLRDPISLLVLATRLRKAGYKIAGLPKFALFT